MAGDALGAENAAAEEHANVPGGSQEHHGAHEEVHPHGNSIYRLHMPTQRLYTRDKGEGTEGQRN